MARGFEDSANYNNAAAQQQDALSDMRLLGTTGGGGRMTVDANGREQFPTTPQRAYVQGAGDLNAPPPDQTGSDQQQTYPGAPTPGQYSYQRQTQQQTIDTGNGSGTGNGTGNGPWRPTYGADVGKTFTPGSAPPGSQGDNGQQTGVAPQTEIAQQSGLPQQSRDGSGGLPGAQGGLPTADGSSGGLPDAVQPVHNISILGAGLAGGTGAYLLRHPVPKYLTQGSDYVLAHDFKLGTKLFPQNGWLDKTINPNVANKMRTAFDNGPKGSAQWWKDNFNKPPAPGPTGTPDAAHAADAAKPPGEPPITAAPVEATTVPGEAPPITPAPVEATTVPGEAPPITPAPVEATTVPGEAPPITPAPVEATTVPGEAPPITPAPVEATTVPGEAPPITPAPPEGPPITPSPEPVAAAESTLGAEVKNLAGATAKTGLGADVAKAGEFLAKPGVKTFMQGAGIAAGTIAFDHFTPGSDSYGFGTLGVTAAFAGLPEVFGLPGDTKTKLGIAVGTVAAGKVFNWLVPAETHPELHNFLAPGMTDTALMTGALFLPTTDPRLKLAAVGGAYVLGRMGKTDNGFATLGAAGIGLGTYKLTHNPELSVALAAGSFLGSRLLHLL